MNSFRVLCGIAFLFLVGPLAFGQSMVNVREYKRPAGPGAETASPKRGPNGPRALSRPKGAGLIGKPSPLTRPECRDGAGVTGGGSRTPTNGPMPPTIVYVKKHRVDIDIVDGVAVTSIDQTYHNTGARVMEGTYVCPIPKHVVLDRLSIFMAGREVMGSVMDRTRARGIYERIVNRKRDPGLVELIDGGKPSIRVRIFPIPAKGDMRVKIRYSHVLDQDGRHTVTSLPIRSLKTPNSPGIEEFGVFVKARSSWPFLRVFGRGIDLNGTTKDHRCFYSGSFTEENFQPRRDATIRITPNRDGAKLAVHVHRAASGEKFFMAVAAAGDRSLKSVRLSCEGAEVKDVYPQRPRSVGVGQQALWFGKLVGDGKPQIVIKGTSAGNRFDRRAAVTKSPTTAADNSWVAGFWALAKTSEIIGKTGKRNVTAEQKQEVIKLGTRYGILTRFTAILAK